MIKKEIEGLRKREITERKVKRGRKNVKGFIQVSKGR